METTLPVIFGLHMRAHGERDGAARQHAHTRRRRACIARTDCPLRMPPQLFALCRPPARPPAQPRTSFENSMAEPRGGERPNRGPLKKPSRKKKSP